MPVAHENIRVAVPVGNVKVASIASTAAPMIGLSCSFVTNRRMAYPPPRPIRAKGRSVAC